MEIFWAIVFGLLSVTLHELGHYEAMRRCGVRVEEVSLLGLPIPYLPSGYFYYKETWWGVHIFLIGAYVKPYSEKEIETKNTQDQLYIMGNGIVVNLVYALALLAVAVSVMDIPEADPQKQLILSASLALIAGLLWWGRRIVTTFVLPLLVIPVCMLVAYSLVGVGVQEAVDGGAGGPIAIVAMLAGAKTFPHALSLAAFLSLNLAIFNLLPLFPLDGGRIFNIILARLCKKKVVENIFKFATAFLMLLLLVYSFALDAFRVWGWF